MFVYIETFYITQIWVITYIMAFPDYRVHNFSLSLHCALASRFSDWLTVSHRFWCFLEIRIIIFFTFFYRRSTEFFITYYFLFEKLLLFGCVQTHFSFNINQWKYWKKSQKRKQKFVVQNSEFNVNKMGVCKGFFWMFQFTILCTHKIWTFTELWHSMLNGKKLNFGEH